jgi:phosphohistidine phosphatase
MRILYVLRHAKSDWGTGEKDFDRPLNERGRKAAKAIGKELRKRKIEPDLVLASPALRAKQTLQRVQDGYGGSFRIAEDRRIYMADSDELLEVIRSAPDDAKRLMIVGHNPGLHELVAELSGARDEVDSFPTGALAEIEFGADSWRNLASSNGKLKELLKPRDL